MNIERNYLRRSYRINLPAYATVLGKKYKAKDWSFLGFRIDTGNSDKILKKNESYDILFELPFAGFDLRFKTKALCKWISGKEAGFEFEELSDEIKLVMKEYVEAYIEGRLENSEGLLKIAQGIEIPIDTEIKTTEEEQKQIDSKFIKMIAVYFFIFLAVSFAIYKIYINKNVVYSAEAFVSGNYFNISSPVNGKIETVNIHVGEKIKPHQLVAVIKNTQLDIKIKELKEEKKILKSKLKTLKKMLSASKSAQNPSRIISELNSILIKKERLLKKEKHLYRLGLVSPSKITSMENDIENLKLKIKLLKTDSGSIQNLQLQNSIKINILNTKNRLENLNYRIKTLNQLISQEYIYSPYEGKVLNIYKNRCDLINKADIIATINIQNSKVYVIGRFKYKDALNVYLNDKAKIYIPSLHKSYKGKVAAIGLAALNGSVPSDLSAYTRKDIPIKVEISDPDRYLLPGIAAEIEITGN